MPKPNIGLLLAATVMAMPLAAHADCPPESSIDRYVQTANDALSALDGLVPDSQQQALEDRATALTVLQWQWRGRSSLQDNPSALTQLVACYKSDQCSLDPSIGMNRADSNIAETLIDSADAHKQLEGLLTQQPSYRILDWAEDTLGCERTNPAPDPNEVSDDPEIEEPDAEIIENSADEEQEQPSIDLAQADPDEREEADEVESETDNLEDEILAEADPVENAAPPVEAPADFASNSGTETGYLAGLDPALLVQTPARLMGSAASFAIAGNAPEALKPLRAACFLEATTRETSPACDTLSSVYRSSAALSAQLANSATYLEHSKELCELNYLGGCLNLSRYFQTQTKQDVYPASLYYTERACWLGDGESCATVERYYLNPRTTNSDPIRALEELEQSCAQGEALSCQEAANLHLRGVGGEADVDQAFRLNEAACPPEQAPRADACVAAADFVLINMQSSPERRVQVRTFIQRACAIGHDVGCAWYAEDLELGIGGAVDPAGAKRARVTACQFGHEDSCNSRS